MMLNRILKFKTHHSKCYTNKRKRSTDILDLVLDEMECRQSGTRVFITPESCIPMTVRKMEYREYSIVT